MRYLRRAMSSPEPVRFHFDYLSPYAYLAWQALPEIAARHGREVVAVPTLFAALLGAAGTKGPAEIPAKRVYVFKDAMRSAHALGVPFAPPPAHPFNPLLALRVSSLDLDEAVRARVVSRLFAATWGGGAGVDGEATVRALLDELGLDGAAMVREASSDATKARLRAATDAAIAAGAFGVPTMFVDGELFWGLDSLRHVDARLAGRDPIDDVDLSRWAHTPATAKRRGS